MSLYTPWVGYELVQKPSTDLHPLVAGLRGACGLTVHFRSSATAYSDTPWARSAYVLWTLLVGTPPPAAAMRALRLV